MSAAGITQMHESALAQVAGAVTYIDDMPEVRGTLHAAPPEGAAAPRVITTLRDAALNEDWAAWAQAWRAIDGNECAALRSALERGEPVQLTLCGERNAQGFRGTKQPVFKRLLGLFETRRAATFLETL